MQIQEGAKPPPNLLITRRVVYEVCYPQRVAHGDMRHSPPSKWAKMRVVRLPWHMGSDARGRFSP